MQNLIEVRGISVLLLPRSQPRGVGLLHIPGVDSKPFHLRSIWPGGLWGWWDALLWGAPPRDGQDTVAGGSGAFRFFSLGKAEQSVAACWQEGFGEGEGRLAHGVGELRAAGRGMIRGPGHSSTGLLWHRVLLPSPAALEGLVP